MTLVALCTLAFFATMVARLVISPVVPEIVETFDSSTGVLGLALTGLWMAYAFAQFPSGVLADRYGERIIILVAIGLTTVASALLALSPSMPVFLIFTLILGGVAGLHYSVATTLLTRELNNIGTAIGLHNSGAPLAGLLAPIAAAAVSQWFGWRAAIALGAVAALPVFVLFRWKVRPTEPARPEQSMGDRFALKPVVELLSRRKIAFTAVLAFLFEFIWQATASFLPTFLIAYHGYSVTFASALFSAYFVIQGLTQPGIGSLSDRYGFASALFSAYFVIQGLTQPGIGSLSDRYGREETAGFCAVLGISGFTLLLVGSRLAVLLVGIVLIGVSMGGGAALLPRFMDNLSDEERGAGFGLVRTAYMMMSATGSVVVGTIADTAGWGIAFGTFVVFLSVICLSLVGNRMLDLGF
ncbi:major facilitator superfamily protein [Halococcus morrhuae DSM 1307]|uniref:Major facilitator superfamily protein n=1 Tax=Halococcus morrhuae DSM 1307 TaxID=931277 RepID=M0M7Y4_HALMO|nr:major facilitator superfamily protein [Halococcus morrhuae DSM 1307]